MTTLWFVNVVAFSLQLAVVVAAAVLASTALRLRAPRPSLRFWQLVLFGTIALPIVQTGTTPSLDAPTATARILAYGLATSSLSSPLSNIATIGTVVVVSGAVTRLAWLALGLARLRLIRLRSTPISPMPAFVGDLCARLGLGATADIRVSDDVDGPVALGFRRPVILLPSRALVLPIALQQAITCHELLHVKRHDWAHNLFEQVWCAMLWFHPAAQLMVARLHFLREAVVDRDAISVTGDRRSYASALLAFAVSNQAPATVLSLIRPRHLSQRIALIVKESPMPSRHLVAGLVGATVLTAAAAIASASRFPLVRTAGSEPAVVSSTGMAQTPVRPGSGVSVPRVIKDVKPQYTPDAMRAKIAGSILLDVVVLTSGDVGDVTVVKSLDTEHGLDAEAVRAASQWKFVPARRGDKAVPVIVTIEMTFTLKP